MTSSYRLPEETEEDKEARERKRLSRDLSTAAYKFGPKPPDMIADINPVPELSTGLARENPLPWGGTIRRATEKTGYGEKRFSNVPEDAGRADTTFITEAPKKEEKTTDFEDFDLEAFSNHAREGIKTKYGVDPFENPEKIARVRKPGATPQELQAEIKKVIDLQSDAYKLYQGVVAMASKKAADITEKKRYAAEKETARAKENQARVDKLRSAMIDLKTKQKSAVVSLAHIQAKGNSDFSDANQKAMYENVMKESGAENLNPGEAKDFLTGYVADLDKEINRIDSELKTYDPTYDAMAGIMGQAHEPVTGVTEPKTTQVSPAATATKYLKTATNPKTGEKIGFDGTKWVLIPQT